MTLDALNEIGLNTRDGLAYCAMDEEFYSEMIEEYVTEKDERVKELTEGFDGRDWERYRIAAHSIKGTSRMIGAVVMSESAREMEQACKDGNEDKLLAEHERFLSEYIKLVEKLRQAISA